MIEHRNTPIWCIQGHSFYAPALNETSVVLDIGASTAAFAIALAEAKGCRCHAVEALPENYERIGVAERITKHLFVMGGSEELRTLYLADEATRWGSIRSMGGVSSSGVVEVPGMTLDGFVGLVGADVIDLAKIDIEGAEIEMFEAASDETLRRFAQITIEFHDFMDPGLADAVPIVLDRFRRLGFRVIVYTRRFHGDVLLINPAHIEISMPALLYFRHVTKNVRGIGRILARTAA